MSEKIRLCVSLGRRDRERLEVLSRAHSISFASIVRMSLRAACRELGVETTTTDDLAKKLA